MRKKFRRKISSCIKKETTNKQVGEKERDRRVEKENKKGRVNRGNIRKGE